jgi:hypothetical protein
MSDMAQKFHSYLSVWWFSKCGPWTDYQPQLLLDTCQICRFWGSTYDQLFQKSWGSVTYILTNTPGDFFCTLRFENLTYNIEIKKRKPK